MTREQGTGNREHQKRFWDILLFVTYFGFFLFTYLGREYLLKITFCKRLSLQGDVDDSPDEDGGVIFKTLFIKQLGQHQTH